ncbi:hypothetical protein CVV67_13795, partial [Arthrobacter stackebrandtii]
MYCGSHLLFPSVPLRRTILMPGPFTNISRRGLLAAATAGAATVAVAPLSPAGAESPPSEPVADIPAVPPATLAELEAKAMMLKPPVFLLETAVPTQFSTSGKSQLGIVSEVNHTGNSSLRWDYESQAVLTVQAPLGIVPPSAASGGNGADIGLDVNTLAFWTLLYLSSRFLHLCRLSRGSQNPEHP